MSQLLRHFGRSGMGYFLLESSSLSARENVSFLIGNTLIMSKCMSTAVEPFFKRSHWRVPEKEKEPLPENDVITVPLALQKRLEKKMIRVNTERHKRNEIIKASRLGCDKILIHSKRAELNHYLGQSYGRYETIPTVSKGWGHYKSVGDWFTIKPATTYNTYGFSEGLETTFEELGVSEKLVEKLKENKAFKPTIIQTLAIPKILKGCHHLVAAETGCGKTLAYLVPLVQQTLLEKRLRKKRGFNQPLAIIIVSSHELASQIAYVTDKLTEGLDIDVKLLRGGNIGSKISNPPTANLDILISTVNALTQLTTMGVYNISRVQHLVLDEADTLLDDSYNTDILEFLARFQLNPAGSRVVQLSLVSATLPKSVENTLAELLPVSNLEYISTPGLHYVMPHVPQTFLRFKKSKKPEKLLEIVQSDLQNKIPLMIFCNQTKTCDWMKIMFREKGIPCICVHGEVRPAARKGLLEKYQNGEYDILICTDLGSRGINSVRTGHVLNYEFPINTADYIHRCGRTGRVGAKQQGKVTNFITRKSELQAVNDIELSIRKESTISKVDANVKRILNSKYGMYKPITGYDAHDENKDKN